VSTAEAAAELGSRINIIEEAYEFMLAYASRGSPPIRATTPAARRAST
jgi:hypothetical protein